jgi:hypothetical protein
MVLAGWSNTAIIGTAFQDGGASTEDFFSRIFDPVI